MRYVSVFPVIRRVKIFPHPRPRAENFPFSFQKNEPQNRTILTFFCIHAWFPLRIALKRLKTAFLDFYRDLAQKPIFLPRKIASPHRFFAHPNSPDSDTGRGKILTCSASFYVPPRENVPYGTIANAFPVLIYGVDSFVSLTRYIFPFSRKTFIPSASPPRKIIYCNPHRIFVDK